MTSEKLQTDTALPSDAKEVRQEAVVRQEYGEYFAGPIPHPQILAGYESVLSGSADRILNMAEAQAAHRQAIEARQIEADIEDGRKGMRFALIVSLAMIFCGTGIIMVHPDTGGYISGSLLNVVGMTSVIRAFLRSDKTTPDKNETKEDNNPQ